MTKIEFIPTLQDNFVWALHNDPTDSNPSAILVDPGEAAPILAWLRQRNLSLHAILVTHHHYDHVGGIAELLKHYPVPVYGPTRGAANSMPVSDGDNLEFAAIGMNFSVIATPGHTLDHVCYVGSRRDATRDEPVHLFCGDTLFSVGCGRLFEGTPAEMYASLSRLAQLPDSTQMYCAHEYTLENIAFALKAEPDNAELQARHAQALTLLKQDKATLPVAMGVERATNPFLRCDLPSLTVAASQHVNKALQPGVETFAVVRAWRDEV